METNLYEIVIVEKTPVQVVGFLMDSGIDVQDIHTKTRATHKTLISKATKDEVKWFCENTEHTFFIPPNSTN